MQNTTPTIDDLITRGIPGAIVTGSFLIASYGSDLSWPSSSLSVVGFLAISYTLGTFVDLHKYDFFNAPPHFRRLLYTETENTDYLRYSSRAILRISRHRLFRILWRFDWWDGYWMDFYTVTSEFSEKDESIKNTLQQREHIAISPENMTDTWLELERITSPELGRLGENQQTVYHFLLNFFFAVPVAAVLLILGRVSTMTVSASSAGLLVLGVIALLVLEVNVLGRYSTRYSQSVVQAYYRVSENARNENHVETSVVS